uniref:hypothetical protein n=1 Tax=Faecalibacterium prausnitzii TaxID=853 RepID=UPI004038EC1D
MEHMNFRVESPENFVKMACTILFGKREELNDYATVWHDVFEGNAGDQRFRQFMEELFPDGCTIGEKELHQLTDRAIRYLKTETICLDIKGGMIWLRLSFGCISSRNIKSTSAIMAAMKIRSSRSLQISSGPP